MWKGRAWTMMPWMVSMLVLSLTASAMAQPSRDARIAAVLDAEPVGQKVIDLGEKGLKQGEAIDPYFNKYFKAGVQLRIPQGVYDWNMDYIEFIVSKDASIIGEGRVTLRVPLGYNAYQKFHARDGATLEVRNITLERQGGVKGMVHVMAVGETSRVIFRNFNQPDGSIYGGRQGIFVNRMHEGAFYVINCHIEGFSDNGLYASPPGREDREHGDGPVHVIGGLYRNNNITNVRVGSDDSTVRGVTSIQDFRAEPERDLREGVHQRGIWVREAGDHILIEDCDVIQKLPHLGVILQPRYDQQNNCTIRDMRIYDTRDQFSAIVHTGGDWSGQNFHFTGPGDLTIDTDTPGRFKDVVTGANAELPRYMGPARPLER